ncbi:MAG: creatininase family protein [Deltaproteobacteria bacterium]|nr:creatininase family protein [Deltaproteobacteria bacterium]
MLIGENTMSEFGRNVKKTRTLIIPFGTVEAHGDHLPINTDTLIIREVIKKVAEKNNVYMAPPIQYGVCTSTSAHPGTLGITTQSLRLIATDIVRSAYAHGLRNFILISGHGGSLHVSALREVAENLTQELDKVKIAALSIYELLGKETQEIIETKGDSHAGEAETSLVLHLAPKLIKGRSKEEYPRMPKPIAVKDKDKLKYWPGAVWGNPQKASADKGEKLFKVMVEKVEELIKRIEKLR